MTKNIRLELIESNPWQPRTSMDAAGIEALALSIAREGLMQVPVGRKNPGDGGVFQLAIGHRRLAAYSLINDIANSPADGHDPALVEAIRKAIEAGRTFDEIPLDMQDLTDQQMFEMALSENLQRQDLNPIEIAAAERRYMDEFEATSKQAGEFFGKSDATIRGDVRLLDLPEAAKVELAEGRITVGTARKLLTVQKADDEGVKMAIEAIAKGGDVEEIVNRALSKNAFCMWESWLSQEMPMAGSSLWALSEPVTKAWKEHIPELDVRWAVKAINGTVAVLDVSGPEFTATVNSWNYDIASYPTPGLNDDVTERLRQLFEPPACTACPMYVKNAKAHYCTWKPCWERKRKGWGRMELEKVSKKLKIPIFDPETDPKESVSVDTLWSRDHDWMSGWKREGKADYYKKIFADRTADTTLRLRLKWPSGGMYGGNQHCLTDHHSVEVVDTDPKMIKWLEKQKESNIAAKEKKQSGQSASDLEYARKHANQRLFGEFIEQIAGPIFGDALAGLDNLPLLQQFARLDDDDLADLGDAEKKRRCRIEIMGDAISETLEWEEKATGPAGCAEKVAAMANAWGVKLPADWQAQAEAFGAAVAAETDAA